MLDSLFRGVFDTQLTSVIAPADFLLCVGVSLWCFCPMSARRFMSETAATFG